MTWPFHWYKASIAAALGLKLFGHSRQIAFWLTSTTSVGYIDHTESEA